MNYPWKPREIPQSYTPLYDWFEKRERIPSDYGDYGSVSPKTAPHGLLMTKDEFEHDLLTRDENIPF